MLSTAKVLGAHCYKATKAANLVGRDGIEKYQREIREYFPCCPLCGSRQLVPKLVPGGRDSIICSECNAEWHLIIGLGGLKWAELERLSKNGEGRAFVGRRMEKERWQKMAQDRLYSKAIKQTAPTSEVKEVNQIIREREIIKQTEIIVKIRCSYCKTVYIETMDKCPNCGARA